MNQPTQSEKKVVNPSLRAGTYLVTKSNAIIEASYRLTLQEQRLILFCVAQIDSRRPLEEQRAFSVEAQLFRDTFGIAQAKVYEELRDATKRLWEREITVVDAQNGHDTHIRWVSQVRYHHKHGRVTLNFSPEMLPFISAIKDRFTSYPLESISRLSSTFSIRLFEILTQYTKFGRRQVSTLQLRRWLDCVDTYPRFSEFDRWVVAPAVAQLNERTALRVHYEKLKSGRDVTGLDFTISTFQPRKLPDTVPPRMPLGDEVSEAHAQWEADMRRFGADPAKMIAGDE